MGHDRSWGRRLVNLAILGIFQMSNPPNCWRTNPGPKNLNAIMHLRFLSNIVTFIFIHMQFNLFLCVDIVLTKHRLRVITGTSEPKHSSLGAVYGQNTHDLKKTILFWPVIKVTSKCTNDTNFL